jgi:hypothetical protein
MLRSCNAKSQPPELNRNHPQQKSLNFQGNKVFCFMFQSVFPQLVSGRSSVQTRKVAPKMFSKGANVLRGVAECSEPAKRVSGFEAAPQKPQGTERSYAA